MPKVSVNIPCFNSARFIKETLHSVLNQTFEDFEIIIINDGSSDSTEDIITTFKDRRIKYFYKKNEGLSPTRNKAIFESSGEYIAFLDHDDLWLPPKLEKQLKILERNRDIALIFSDSYILINGVKELWTYFDRCIPQRGLIFEDLLFESSNFIPLSTVVMRKEVFQKVGFFNERFKQGEDLDIFLRVAEKYEFEYINEPLAIYRVHENNFSHNKEISTQEGLDILNFWKVRKPELFQKNRYRYLKRQACLLSELGNFYGRTGKRKEAISKFTESIKKNFTIATFLKRMILKSFGCWGFRFSLRLSRYFNILRNLRHK